MGPSGRTLKVPPKGGKYDWKSHSCKFPTEGRGIVLFESNTNEDILVGLSPEPQTTDSMYEIVIGGWGKSKSIIARRQQGRSELLIDIGNVLKDGGEAEAGSFHLWVSIDAQTQLIQVGQGDGSSHEDVFLVYKDPNFDPKLQYVCFSSYSASIKYTNIRLPTISKAGPGSYPNIVVASPRLLSSQPLIPQCNSTYDWKPDYKLPTEGRGIVSFAAIASSSMKIAISPQPGTVMPMYEIIIGEGCWIRRSSLGYEFCVVKTADLIFTSPHVVELKEFWVSIDAETKLIHVGQGRRADLESAFCIYKDPDFITEARYVSFSSNETPNTYSEIWVSLPTVATSVYGLNFGGADSPHETPRHFYGNQCRVLEKKLSIAEEILHQDDVSSADLFFPESMLTELRRVVKVCKSLIELCHDDKLCQKAYLRQGERTGAFLEALKEVVWCTSVAFYYNNRRCTQGKPSMDEVPQVESSELEFLKYLLQKAALADQKELQASLDPWIQDHSCSTKECGRSFSDDTLMCLAAQILARISNGEGDINCEADHTSALWKTTQEALEDVRKIGKGSYGTVFETLWLGDKYAKKEFNMAPKFFEDEVRALSKLNHPHIVKVSACNAASHMPCFFLMEIMPQDLRSYMKDRMNRHRISPPFSISASIDLMLQLSEAMSYMNSEGFVHRDLKAENILVKPVDEPELCEEGFVIAKLADFGLAKSKHEITAHSHLTRENLGTKKWMAPEMYRSSKAELDGEQTLAFPRKADVYSYGVVCSEILTGMYPFHNVEHLKMSELYQRITDSVNPLRPELPQGCPENLANLIRNCWHKDPVKRPTFKQISETLRYLKGLLMLTGQCSVQDQDGVATHLTEKIFTLEHQEVKKCREGWSSLCGLSYWIFSAFGPILGALTFSGKR